MIISILRRSDVRIFIICTVTGGLLQVVAKRYVKNHPRFSHDEPLKVDPKNDLPVSTSPTVPTGGALVEISIGIFNVALDVAVKFLASKGLIAGVTLGTGIVGISKISSDALSTYIRDALPSTLPHLERDNFILLDGEKIYIDQCDNTLRYLFKVLQDDGIPYEERKQITERLLTQMLDLRTTKGKVNFIICILLIISVLYTQDTPNFVMLLQNLVQAIKEGRISRSVARVIIRRMRKAGYPIDPELIEAAYS